MEEILKRQVATQFCFVHERSHSFFFISFHFLLQIFIIFSKYSHVEFKLLKSKTLNKIVNELAHAKKNEFGEVE
ncbi:hypothetical protein BpHYR1_019257 [Brachionus plicatilis]|uniref:Uncharacterized protein n=1 Tax=Brachionus plicatilis TaxID=10195 RepID=A0A3M7PFC2_BRAPC|nr:hypothetical protein BpHYR1_019257 [Brachionus plicatilis]